MNKIRRLKFEGWPWIFQFLQFCDQGRASLLRLKLSNDNFRPKCWRWWLFQVQFNLQYTNLNWVAAKVEIDHSIRNKQNQTPNFPMVTVVWNNRGTMLSKSKILHEQVRPLESIFVKIRTLDRAFSQLWNRLQWSRITKSDVSFSNGDRGFSQLRKVASIIDENHQILVNFPCFSYAGPRLQPNLKSTTAFITNKIRHIKFQWWPRLLPIFVACLTISLISPIF